MQSFYWLVEGTLAGCGRPGGDGGRAAGATEQGGHDVLEADLGWLRRREIAALVSLTEVGLPEEALGRHGFEALHLPVDDLTAPTPVQLETALRFIDRQRAFSRAVAVHCRMGQGRTGTVLAAYLIRDGLPASEALARLRALCPGAVGTTVQEQALHAFARRRDWIL